MRKREIKANDHVWFGDEGLRRKWRVEKVLSPERLMLIYRETDIISAATGECKLILTRKRKPTDDHAVHITASIPSKIHAKLKETQKYLGYSNFSRTLAWCVLESRKSANLE